MSKNKGKVSSESTAIVARPLTHRETIQINRPHNYVEALPYDDAPIDRRRQSDVMMPDAGDYSLRAPQGATQHIEMRTSHVDRAKGHLIFTVPMIAIVALLVPVVKAMATEAPVTVMAGLTLWFVTFAILWAGTWVVSLVISAEGIGLISELLKWKLLFREQDRRWQHYERMVDDE